MTDAAVNVRCSICRMEVDLDEDDENMSASRRNRFTCDRCKDLLRAPACLACGEQVRDGDRKSGEDAYHKECRRCSSCYTCIEPSDVNHLAGQLLCKPCSNLFGKFFLPERRGEVEHMKEAFQAWDNDGSGSIESAELRRVLKALDPDFSERDISKLIRQIDANGNGMVDFNEFCEWVMGSNPLHIKEDGFTDCVNSLMRAAGKETASWKMDIAELQVRDDGIYFVTEAGETRQEATSVRSDSLELVMLDPEEFITKIESNEQGLLVTLNTGRLASMGGHGQHFGPWQAPEGFHIIGFRTKPPTDDDSEEKVVGLDFSPLSKAKSYHAAASLRFAAEKEFLSTLRELLSQGAVDIDSFGIGGVTALMLAAQYGNLGAMRLLLDSKARPDIADEDGWTALTFASKCGNNSAVELLIKRGKDKSQKSDGGKALRQALSQEHNSAARALLRAGFGPAPSGAYSLETAAETGSCRLQPPHVSPASGNYASPVKVVITHETLSLAASMSRDQPATLEEAQAKLKAVTILYTLDGRDPFVVGTRYRGGLKLSAERSHLRVVAVKGIQRSVLVDRVYQVCHYPIPDEVITGVLRVRTFPGINDMLRGGLCDTLDIPTERLRISIEERDAAEDDKNWFVVDVTDDFPRHRLIVDKPFKIVGDQKKKKAYVEKFCADVQRAVGATPADVKVTAGSIVLDFSLPRQQADDMAEDLGDPTSYLLSGAKLKLSFNEAQFQPLQVVAEKIRDTAIHTKLHATLGKKAIVDEVVGIGEGDRGVIAVAAPSDQAKKLTKLMEKSVQASFPGVRVGGFRVLAEKVDLSYTIDVLNGVQEDGDWQDAGALISKLNASDYCQKLTYELAQRGLCAETQPLRRATSRGLSQLEFHLEWEFPRGSQGTRMDYLDGCCLVYQEHSLLQIVDFRSAHQDRKVHSGKESRSASRLCRAITRALRHSGDDTTSTGGQHRITLDLAALPSQVTDIYFVLSAFESRDLSRFRNPTIEIHDAVTMRPLTEYTLSSAGNAQAVVMCSLSKAENRKWIVHGLGIPTDGNVEDYTPIRETIAKLQEDYSNWDRRKNVIKLRLLDRDNRMTSHSTSETAALFRGVLNLPIPLFQHLVKFL
eukprot:TRINITY_DN18778_c0_g1_i1.p1 TRINITY_DN18778_c0_g1~~TRINITY_DN18778_c0_g1_i1.p1  ORF type:complete len:1143 (+),score=210.58 TRINITY_DN18778_c0_g1_i1:104-3430(+)